MPPPRKPGSVKDMSKDRADSKKNVALDKARQAAEQADRAKADWMKKAKPVFTTALKDAVALEKSVSDAAAAMKKAAAEEKARQAALKAEIEKHKKDGTLTASVGAAIKTQAEQDAKDYEEQRKRREATVKGLLKGFEKSMKELGEKVEQGTKTGIQVDPGGKMPPQPPPTGDILQIVLWAGALVVYLRHLMKQMK
jgi:hypothetical protein